ncbi:MAG: gliding motility-associated C-terminal domain-containing protein [Bacteroidales bacterium]|nr:gliding motility-associated C-terminal domain-containing protein [Bacteroidales bacterium]
MRTVFIAGFLLISIIISGQVDAGDDITVSAGIPVKLSGQYKGYFGVPVTAQDDYFVGPFPIGFEFEYFGNTYTEFAIGPNGLLSFDIPAILGLSYWKQALIPNSIFPETIMGPYQDLFSRPTQPHSGYIYYQVTGTAPARKLVAGWCEAPMYNCPDKLASFQIVLEEGTHHVYNHITIKPDCFANYSNNATQGLNKDKNTGVVIPGRNWESFTVEAESRVFRPAGPDNYETELIPFAPEPVVPKDNLSWNWFEGSYPGGKHLGSSERLVVSPLETTTYFAEITLCSGVKYTDDITVFVLPLPNAFHPESEIEKNRTFRVYAHPPEKPEAFSMQIFNRWGQKVFETNRTDMGWDGTNNGNICPSGVYVWVILVQSGEEKLTHKGYVTLIR